MKSILSLQRKKMSFTKIMKQQSKIFFQNHIVHIWKHFLKAKKRDPCWYVVFYVNERILKSFQKLSENSENIVTHGLT